MKMGRVITFHSLGRLRRLKWRVSARWLEYRRRRSGAIPVHYDIAVTTYVARFDTYFKSLLSQLLWLFPDRRILVVANGHHERARQEAYLDDLRKLVARSPGVTLIAYSEPVGLARMWNDALRASTSGRLLMLNDDLYLMANFRIQLEASGLLKEKIATINGTWSHFLITQDILDAIGWFDEDFVEIGYEDADYEVRLACRGIPVARFQMNGLWSWEDQPAEYSYGPQLAIRDGKYSGRNRNHFFGKWKTFERETPGCLHLPMVDRWVQLQEPGRRCDAPPSGAG
jgi:hypothetical protein